jgi:hypothetical protein
MAIVVKQLEWEESRDFWKAETIVGTYYVDDGDWWLAREGDDREYGPRFKDDEMAKQACWVHFESIVRSAIDGEITPADRLHDRLEMLAKNLKGEYPPQTITDVMQASRMSKAFDVLVSRGCDHCADSIKAAREMAE